MKKLLGNLAANQQMVGWCKCIIALRSLTAEKKTRDVLRVQSSIYHSVFGRTGTAVERVLAL